MKVKNALRFFVFLFLTYSNIYSLQNPEIPVDCYLSGGIPPVDLSPDLKPAYTQEAYDKKISGMVTLEVIISKDGTVKRATLIRKIGFGLDIICLEVYIRKKFSPCIIGGKAVTSKVLIPIMFSFGG